jgi:hypothetical protein
VRQVEEGGKRRFVLDHAHAHDAVAEMLKMVGDLRSTGDKVGSATLRERLAFTDPLKDEIERRTADLPLGLGLIFPRLKMADGRYTRELVYPERFEQQPKFGYEVPESEAS